MDEPLNLAHSVVDAMDISNRNISVIRRPYKKNKPESSYAEVPIIARKETDKKFKQFRDVKCKLQYFILLLVVIVFVFDEVSFDKPIYNVILKVIISVYLLSLSLLLGQRRSWKDGHNRNLVLRFLSKLEFYNVVLTTLRSFLEKMTLIRIEIQHLPQIEKADLAEEISRPKQTFCIGRRKCV